MSILWPNRVTVNPSLTQVLMRIVHWVCALVSIYFVYKAFAYMLGTQGVPQWKEVSKFIGLAIGFWLGGRGLRFILAGE